jgi:hypothetical protein
MKIEGAPPEVTFEKTGRIEIEAVCSVCQAIIGYWDIYNSHEELRNAAEWHVNHDQEHMKKLTEKRVKESEGC